MGFSPPHSAGNIGFLAGNLFLWVSVCVGEFRAAYRIIRIVRKLPLLPADMHEKEMVVEGDAEDRIGSIHLL